MLLPNHADHLAISSQSPKENIYFFIGDTMDENKENFDTLMKKVIVKFCNSILFHFYL